MTALQIGPETPPEALAGVLAAKGPLLDVELPPELDRHALEGSLGGLRVDDPTDHIEATPMNAPERPACTALISYMHGDDDLWYQLRMVWEWKDHELRRLVETAMRCLEEIEADDMIERGVVYFFSTYLSSLEELMQHPDFITFNRAGRAEQETKAYFAARIEIIRKLMRWMSNGKCPYPLTDFILPEWKSPQ